MSEKVFTEKDMSDLTQGALAFFIILGCLLIVAGVAGYSLGYKAGVSDGKLHILEARTKS